LLYILSATTLFSGCAFTVHDTPINYQYTGKELILNQEGLPKIEVGQITDFRSIENPRMILSQKNGYGQTTSGGWQAEKELSLIVQDALKQGIEKAGLNSESERQVAIRGQLIDVDSTVISGWIKGNVRIKLSVKLTARLDDGTILWQDTIYGDATSEKISKINDGLPQVFGSALNDLVHNFLNDEYFQQQVL